MKIRLETSLGELVAQGEIMHARVPFELLLWGSRCFVYQQHLTDAGPTDGPLIYREGRALLLSEGLTWKEGPR